MTPKNPRQKTKGWCWVEPGWAPRGPEALLGALGAQEHCRGHPHPCPVTAAMGDPGPERLAAQVTHEATGQGREDAGPAALCASPRALAPPPHTGVPPTTKLALCWMGGPGVTQRHTTCWERVKGLGVGVQQLLRREGTPAPSSGHAAATGNVQKVGSRV